MRVFITGIQGVLGSVLKDELRRRGHDVYGCDLTHSDDPKIVRADITEHRQLSLALWELGKDSPLISFKNFDLLFHFGAEFGRINGTNFYQQLWRTNMIGTQNVIEECAKRDIRLVFASSSEAYGMSEKYNGDKPLTEELLDHKVPQFHNIYALSKYTNEQQIKMAVRNDGLKAIILRFFNVYGPPERYSPYRSVVCQFIYKMLKGLPITVNREGKRSHLWIGDWANTVANIANQQRLNLMDARTDWLGSAGAPYTPVFNIGGNEYESILDLYRRLSNFVGLSSSPVTFIDSEKANTATKRPDCSQAITWLGHDPQMPLSEGLFRTITWMKKTL